MLLPVRGDRGQVFDTQVAAALVGLPAQVGYARAGARCSASSCTRARPAPTGRAGRLSAAQIDYALDDVRHLPPLAQRLRSGSRDSGDAPGSRRRWREIGCPESFVIDPEQAWLRIKAFAELDPDARAWRARSAPGATQRRSSPIGRAAGSCRTRRCATSCCSCRARRVRWRAIAELPAGLRENSGAQILELHRSGAVAPGRTAPRLPQRRATGPARKAERSGLANSRAGPAASSGSPPKSWRPGATWSELAGGRARRRARSPAGGAQAIGARAARGRFRRGRPGNAARARHRAASAATQRALTASTPASHRSVQQPLRDVVLDQRQGLLVVDAQALGEPCSRCRPAAASGERLRRARSQRGGVAGPAVCTLKIVPQSGRCGGPRCAARSRRNRR